MSDIRGSTVIDFYSCGALGLGTVVNLSVLQFLVPASLLCASFGTGTMLSVPY